tara:strand:- start:1288 stop:1491 length:204 start_codon:yes stop_codon:yes gene_type:complete
MSTSVEIRLSQNKELKITTRCELGVWNFTFSPPSDLDPAVFEAMPRKQVLFTLHALTQALDNFSKEK